MKLSIHRKDQWFLCNRPWICVHFYHANGSRRVFCLWSGGIEIGGWLWQWSATQWVP